MTLRVLIADDHPLFRDGIVSLLEAAGMEVVGQAGNGREALQVARQTRPDVVLMDVHMPEVDGIEATRALKAELPDIDVVMLTASSEDEHLVSALQAGAQGYLLKNMTSDEFLSMLQGLGRGEAPLSRSMTGRLFREVARSADAPAARDALLTERELELLRWVAEGYVNKEIAREMSISENTVKYHLKNVMQKLHVRNRAEAVARAVQQNYLDPRSIDTP